MLKAVKSEMFRSKYATVFDGDERWRSLPSPTGERFAWDDTSTYIRNPPFFEGLTLEPTPPTDIVGARALAVLGDSVTTDHISPAGSIPVDSPAGKYLVAKGVKPGDFNSYGARRGNHEVMLAAGVSEPERHFLPNTVRLALRDQAVERCVSGRVPVKRDGRNRAIADAIPRLALHAGERLEQRDAVGGADVVQPAHRPAAGVELAVF